MSTWRDKIANRKQDQLDAERTRIVQVNDISFPSLGGGASVWGGQPDAPVTAAAGGAGAPTMSSLVAEWDAKQKEDELNREYARKAREAEAEAEKSYSNSTYSRFRGLGNSHSRDEDTYYEDEYEDNLPPIPTADTSDDWRQVERVVRKPKKTMLEKLATDTYETPVEETSVWRGEEDSIWDRYQQ